MTGSVQGGLEIMRQSRANESKLECNLRRANDRQSKSSETEQETSDVCKRSHVICNLN